MCVLKVCLLLASGVSSFLSFLFCLICYLFRNCLLIGLFLFVTLFVLHYLVLSQLLYIGNLIPQAQVMTIIDDLWENHWASLFVYSIFFMSKHAHCRHCFGTSPILQLITIGAFWWWHSDARVKLLDGRCFTGHLLGWASWCHFTSDRQTSFVAE